MQRCLAVLAAAFVLAGCGVGRTASPTTTTTSCHTKAHGRAIVKLNRDLEALKTAGRIRVKSKLLGGPAVNHATDRFLLDLERAPISNLMRNRLIDVAAEAVLANCQQCFQALEAARPIPSIAHEGNGANC